MNLYEKQARQQIENDRICAQARAEKKWKIEAYLCEGGDIGFKIFSPSGLSAQAFIFPDGRLSEYGKNANIEFMSAHLRFSDAMVSRLKKAGDDFIKNILPIKFPSEYQEMSPYSF